MAHDAILLESGDKMLLEDGSGVLLLEQQTDEGVHFINTIQHARPDPYLPSKEKNIEVSFTFQIIAGILTRGIIKLGAFTETLPKINIEKSIVISMRGLKDKLKPLADKAMKKANDDVFKSSLLHIVETDSLGTLKIIKALLKKIKK